MFLNGFAYHGLQPIERRGTQKPLEVLSDVSPVAPYGSE